MDRSIMSLTQSNWKQDDEPELEGAIATFTYQGNDDTTPYLFVSRIKGEFGVYLVVDSYEIEIDRCNNEKSAIMSAKNFLRRNPIGGGPKKITRKLDSKGRVSLKEHAKPGDEVELAYLGKKY
jgi:hypothetical protein